MKPRRALPLVALIAAPLAHAQSGHMKGMEMKDMPVKGMEMKAEQEGAGAAHKATGVVTKVDKGRATIRHEPVPSLNWPAMTMTFAVKDKALMEKLAKDKKVDFEFRREGKDYVITSAK